jgi:arylsulfatase A-like enzyme
MRWILICLLITATTGLAADKPNVVVFLVDDMGLMDSSVPFLTDKDGKPERHPLNDYFKTPNMQRLADQGMRFSQFYAMSVCSPTRASIMTGQTSARHYVTQYIKPESNNRGDHGPAGWRWEGIRKGDVTLPGVLRQAGYRTIHSGKAHFGPIGSFAAEPTNIGFDINIAGCAFGAPGSYYGTDKYGHGLKRRVNRAVPGLEKYHGTDVHLTEACTIEFTAAVAHAVKEEKPFFGYLSHYAVHSPFQPDARFITNYSEKYGNRGAIFGSMLEGMDKSLGDVLDQLDELGVAEDTLVIFLGDNGTDAPIGDVHEIACAAPLRAKKGTHYEGGMRVPAIVAWAKPNPANQHQQRLPIAQGAIQRQMGDVTDVFPTVAELCSADVPNNHALDGANLATRLTGKRDDSRVDDFLMHFPHQHRSSYYTVYRKGDWKLVYHYQPTDKFKKFPRHELFNLADDRDESNNLASRQPEKLAAMVKAMQRELEACNAQYPVDAGGKALKPELP